MPAHKFPPKPLDQRIARAIVEEATERAERSGPHNCLMWPDQIGSGGYGVTAWGGHRAHRLAWAAEHGDPGALMVRHVVCGNPPCFDYEHLALGTAAENNADTVAMGRHGGRALKLLDDDAIAEVVALVNGGAKLADVAADLGIGYGTVARAVEGKLSGSVTPARHARKVSDEDVLAARHDLAAKRATIRQISDRLGISWPAAQKMVQGRTYEHVGGPLAPRSPGAKLSKRERIEARRLRVAGLHPEHIAARLGATRSAVDAALTIPAK